MSNDTQKLISSANTTSITVWKVKMFKEYLEINKMINLTGLKRYINYRSESPRMLIFLNTLNFINCIQLLLRYLLARDKYILTSMENKMKIITAPTKNYSFRENLNQWTRTSKKPKPRSKIENFLLGFWTVRWSQVCVSSVSCQEGGWLQVVFSKEHFPLFAKCLCKDPID